MQCSPDWLRTYSNPPVSTPYIQELQECTTIPSSSSSDSRSSQGADVLSFSYLTQDAKYLFMAVACSLAKQSHLRRCSDMSSTPRNSDVTGLCGATAGTIFQVTRSKPGVLGTRATLLLRSQSHQWVWDWETHTSAAGSGVHDTQNQALREISDAIF